MLIQIQNCPISSRSEFIDFQARWDRSDQQPDLWHCVGQGTPPGNSHGKGKLHHYVNQWLSGFSEMVSSGICEIAQWFAALLPKMWLCIPEKAVSALLLCLGDSCGEGYQQQVMARGSGTLPYSRGMEKKCTKLIKVPIVLM